MKYLHIDWINGVMTTLNDKLVLVLVQPNEQGTFNFNFIDPLTDEPCLTESEERELLKRMMQDLPAGNVQQEPVGGANE
ncbi:hypothetical protein ACW5WN_01210 [Aeromonas lacus]|uniref:hypothetical protein n=1 Tax=Aeromonas lacus TaxID=558884 RepID=UPI00051C83F6|nr:hypothetical protein [Aeromonas lacus]